MTIKIPEFIGVITCIEFFNKKGERQKVVPPVQALESINYYIYDKVFDNSIRVIHWANDVPIFFFLGQQVKVNREDCGGYYQVVPIVPVKNELDLLIQKLNTLMFKTNNADFLGCWGLLLFLFVALNKQRQIISGCELFSIFLGKVV